MQEESDTYWRAHFAAYMKANTTTLSAPLGCSCHSCYEALYQKYKKYRGNLPGPFDKERNSQTL